MECGRAGCTRTATKRIAGPEFGLFNLGPTGTPLCDPCAADAENVGFPIEPLPED